MLVRFAHKTLKSCNPNPKYNAVLRIKRNLDSRFGDRTEHGAQLVPREHERDRIQQPLLQVTLHGRGHVLCVDGLRQAIGLRMMHINRQANVMYARIF